MYKKDDVELICKNLTVHRCSFISRQNNSSQWITNKRFLKDESLSEACYFATYALVGGFNSYNTKFFAIDIDGHNREGFEYLKLIYNKVVDILGYPSFTCKSPNGIHAYYLLSDYCNSSILVSGVKNLLSQNTITKDLEVKPTSSVALRLPNYNYVLSKELDYFINIEKFEFGHFLNNCVHFPSFNFIQSQEKVFYKKTTYVEEETIKAGHTNEALNHYIPLWRGYGYSLDEAVNMFYSKLDPSYKGELRNLDRLRKRASYYYKGNSYTYEAFRKDETDYEAKYPNIFEAVINTYLTYSKTNSYNQEKRVRSIKNDLATVLKIYDNNNNIKENKEQLELHSFKNPFFKYEVSRGCYPIPSNSINRNNLLLFIELGLLSLPYGKHYSNILNTCIYYYINLLFIKEFANAKTLLNLFIIKFIIIYFNMFEGSFENMNVFGFKNAIGPPKTILI